MKSFPPKRFRRISRTGVSSFLAIVVVLPLYLTGTALARPVLTTVNDNRLEIEIGLDGHFRSGSWNPFRIRMASSLARMAPLDVELIISSRGPFGPKTLRRYSASLKSHGGAGDAELTVPVFISGGSDSALIRILKDDRELARQVKNLYRAESPSTLLVLILTSQPEKFNIISSIKMQRDIETAFVPSEKLGEDWTFYHSASCVIVDDLRLGSLTGRQFRALRDWLYQGGDLIFTSAGLEANASEERLESLTNFTIGKKKRISAPSELAALFDEKEDLIEYVDVPEVAAGIQDIYLATGGTPLILRHEAGLGVARALTFRPDELSLKEPERLDPLVRKIWTSMISDTGGRAGRLKWETAMTVAPGTETEKLIPPSAIYLLTLVIVLGPLNFVLLRKLDKREYILLTVPIVTIVLGIGAFITGFIIKGNDTVKVSRSVTIGKAGDPVFSHRQYIGILSPRKSLFGLPAVDADGRTPHALEPIMFESWRESEKVGRFPVGIHYDDGRTDVSDIEIPMWGMEFLQFATAAEYEENIDYSMRLEGDSLVGSLENRLPFPLKKCFIVYRHNRTSLGDLEQNTKIDFILKISPPPTHTELRLTKYKRLMARKNIFGNVSWKDSGLDDHELELLGHTFDSYRRHFDYPILVGWADASPAMQVSILDREYEEIRSHLMAFRLPFYLEGSRISVPPGLSRARCISETRCDPYDLRVGTRSPLDLELDLPFNAHEKFEVEELIVHMGRADLKRPHSDRDEGKKTTLKISIYDWTEQDWAELVTADQNEVHHKIEKEPQRYVKFPAGLIRLRAETLGSTRDYSFPDITFSDIAMGDFDYFPNFDATALAYFDISLKGHFPED